MIHWTAGKNNDSSLRWMETLDRKGFDRAEKQQMMAEEGRGDKDRCHLMRYVYTHYWQEKTEKRKNMDTSVVYQGEALGSQALQDGCWWRVFYTINEDSSITFNVDEMTMFWNVRLNNPLCFPLETNGTASISSMDARKVPRSLEEIVRNTKFTKSEIRFLYKGFKQVGNHLGLPISSWIVRFS